MPGHPDARELLGAVRDFIAGLPLEGRDAFHAKVARNVLAIVMREIKAEPDAAEAAALEDFLNIEPMPPLPSLWSSRRRPGPMPPPVERTSPLPDLASCGSMGPGLRRDDDGKLDADVLNHADVGGEICARLRDGRVTSATPGLLDALTAATSARLAVDNPRYATLARLTAEPA